MMTFRTRNEAVGSSLLIIGLLMIVGTLVWARMPLPTAASLDIQNRNQKASVNKEIEAALAERGKTENAIRLATWSVAPEAVGPQAMTKLTELARKRQLKLVAFRPSKVIEGQGLVEVPFAITVDGAFPNAMEFVKDIEKSDLRLAVSTVQVASADTASDRVTGTINVLAYLVAPQAPPAATGVKNAKKTK